VRGLLVTARSEYYYPASFLKNNRASGKCWDIYQIGWGSLPRPFQFIIH